MKGLQRPPGSKPPKKKPCGDELIVFMLIAIFAGAAGFAGGAIIF